MLVIASALSVLARYGTPLPLPGGEMPAPAREPVPVMASDTDDEGSSAGALPVGVAGAG